MTLAIEDLEYSLTAYQPDGDRYPIDDALSDLSWEEFDGELAQRLTARIKVGDVVGSKKSSAQLLANGTRIRLASRWDPGAPEEVFRGTVFRAPTDYAAETHEITAYDPLFPLTQSEDDRYYPAGMTATEIIGDVCRSYNIPHDLKGGPTEKLAKKAYKARSPAEMCIAALRETHKKGGGRWLLQSIEGKATLRRRADNQEMWHFETDNLSGLAVDRSIEQLVTVVKIVGRRKKGGKVLATATSDLAGDVGYLQRIIDRSAYDNPTAAEKAAKRLIEAEGAEQIQHSFVAPDVPTLRRGRRIHLDARAMRGIYIVKSINHDARNRLMSVTVDDHHDDVEYAWKETGLDTWVPPEAYGAGSKDFKGDPSKALGIASGVQRGPEAVYEWVAECAKEAGGGFIITSWNRPGYITTNGTKSCHDGGHAVDVKGGDLAALAAAARRRGAQEVIYPDPDSDGDGIHCHIAPFCG